MIGGIGRIIFRTSSPGSEIGWIAPLSYHSKSTRAASTPVTATNEITRRFFPHPFLCFSAHIVWFCILRWDLSADFHPWVVGIRHSAIHAQCASHPKPLQAQISTPIKFSYFKL